MSDKDSVLVVMTVPQALVGVFVDWLLDRANRTGFTSYGVAGHSDRHDVLNIAEQVTGRQRRHQFQVQLPAAALDEFLAAAHAEFGGASVHYWVLPLIRCGRLGDPL